MNIYDRIKQDHEKQRQLLSQLTDTHGSTERREEYFNALKKELQAHADAEEEFFYIPLIESDIAQDQARHSIAEHMEIDELLEELSSTDMSSPNWLKTAKKLKEEVEHHLDEEEEDVFELAYKIIDKNKAIELAKSFDHSKEQELN